MSDRLDLLDYYTLLDVKPDASVDEIKRAFRRFARRYHPDRFASAPDDKRERASQIYRRGSEAYQILTNAISRRAYDRVLRVGKLRLSAEERERAEAADKATAAPAKNPLGSPQARAYYERAAEAARGGQWREAWRALKAALEHEPDSALLKRRLEQVEVRLRARR